MNEIYSLTLLFTNHAQSTLTLTFQKPEDVEEVIAEIRARMMGLRKTPLKVGRFTFAAQTFASGLVIMKEYSNE